MFHLGDRVILVSDEYPSLIGEKGTIVGVVDHTCNVEWDDADVKPISERVYDFQLTAVKPLDRQDTFKHVKLHLV